MLLGDVKHNVPRTSWQEKKEIPRFLSRLASRVAVDVVPGNHDSDLADMAPLGVQVRPSSGFVQDGVGYFHGHTWPDEKILGATILTSLFVERPWCKYACPYGAVLGISNLFRIFRIRRIPGTCKLDGACDITCPMNIKVSEKTIIRDHQCISCLECTSEAKCPAASTVDFVTIGK